jgi:arylsulfatase
VSAVLLASCVGSSTTPGRDLPSSAPAPSEGTGAATQDKPNIILILADDLGYGDVGCFGAKGYRTPHLDRLAREGMRFTNFSVTQAVCSASRASILTGCYANRVGLQGALNHLSPAGIHEDETLLPEVCKARGYATALFGKWHLGHHPKFLPTRHGFDEFYGIPYPNDNGPLHATMKGLPPLPLLEGERIIGHDPDQSRFTRDFTDRAIGFIERHRARPFFLFLSHVMPHVPIFASDAFRGRSAAGLYGDVVEELDAAVGDVLAALRRLGLDDRTLVIFTSDNGPFLSYGNHAGSAGPFREGKLTTFEGGVRMPCLMRWPGRVPAGAECSEPVSAMDLLPTVAAHVGAPLPERPIDGKDIRALLEGRPGARSPHDALFYYAGEELQAVRSGPWKLHLPHEYASPAEPRGRDGKPGNVGQMLPHAQSGIRGVASRHGYEVKSIALSLFNLADDPGETRDVKDRHPDVVKRLEDLAETMRADLGDALTGRKSMKARAPGRL